MIINNNLIKKKVIGSKLKFLIYCGDLLMNEKPIVFRGKLMRLFVFLFILFIFGLPGLWADDYKEELKQVRAKYDAELREKMIQKRADELNITKQKFLKKQEEQQERAKNFQDICNKVMPVAGLFGGAPLLGVAASLATGNATSITSQIGDVFTHLLAEKEKKENKESQDAYIAYIKEYYPDMYKRVVEEEFKKKTLRLTLKE